MIRKKTRLTCYGDCAPLPVDDIFLVRESTELRFLKRAEVEHLCYIFRVAKAFFVSVVGSG